MADVKQENSPAVNELVKNLEAKAKVDAAVDNPNQAVDLKAQQAVNAPNPTDVAALNIPQPVGKAAQVVSKENPTIPQPHVAAPSATLSKSATKRVFYSRLDGANYYFADGGVASFIGGEYQFDPNNIPDDYIAPIDKDRTESWKKRYNELMYVCTVPNPVFSLERVPLHRSDAVVLREVGYSGGGVAPAQAAASGVGMLGSTQMTSLFKQQ